MNLEYVTYPTRQYVEEILADPAVHDQTKNTIRAGLEADAVDAVYDCELALAVLTKVLRDVQAQHPGTM